MRRIATDGYPAVEPPSTFGRPPRLEWLSIAQLVVDPEYQRPIGKNGRVNVIAIARAFDWSKFSVVVVAPVGGDRFAIVDGQHHVTAAALIGIERVPCAIIEASRAQQAAAFAAINAVVTRMTPLQVHVARLAAGDAAADALSRVCAAAGVEICRYPIPADKMQPGQTLAVGMLARCRARYGDDVLRPALRCLVAAAAGRPGLVRHEIVEAFCAVIEAEPDFARDEAALVAAASSFDLEAARASAWMLAGSSRRAASAAIVEALAEHLEDALPGAAA